MNVLHGVGSYICPGNDYGLTKGYMYGSLMRYGLPWYAGHFVYQGDKIIQDLKRDCDERLLGRNKRVNLVCFLNLKVLRK